MKRELFSLSRYGIEYERVTLDNGLTVIICPMKEYSSVHAMFSTRFGALDRKNPFGEDFPAGMAHFLEHKLFENEEGDAFALFAPSGAYANAYTSYERTCYLFGTAQDAREPLKILLSFVTQPYFTEKSVEKEKGVIGQEIAMYLDNPEWAVMTDCFRAMYQKYPLRDDIAGTQESISAIDVKLLLECYKAYYGLSNMVLTVAGNIDANTVLEICGECLPDTPSEGSAPKRTDGGEPEDVVKASVDREFDVGTPMLCVGYKQRPSNIPRSKLAAVCDIVCELISGRTTDFFRQLYDGGLVDENFFGEAIIGDACFGFLFSCSSREPEAAAAALEKRIEQLKRDGFERDEFERVKRANYGGLVMSLDSAEGAASALTDACFKKCELCDIIDAAASITIEDAEDLLRSCFDSSKRSVVILKPRREDL